MMEPGPYNLRSRLVVVQFIEPKPKRPRTANGRDVTPSVEPQSEPIAETSQAQAVQLPPPSQNVLNPIAQLSAAALPQPRPTVRGARHPMRQKLQIATPEAEADSGTGHNLRKRNLSEKCTCCEFQLTGACHHVTVAKPRKQQRQNVRQESQGQNPLLPQARQNNNTALNQSLEAANQGISEPDPSNLPELVTPDVNQSQTSQPVQNVTAMEVQIPTVDSGASTSLAARPSVLTINHREEPLLPLEKTPDLFDELLDGNSFRTHEDIYNFLRWDDQPEAGTSTADAETTEIETITIPDSPEDIEPNTIGDSDIRDSTTSVSDFATAGETEDTSWFKGFLDDLFPQSRLKTKDEDEMKVSQPEQPEPSSAPISSENPNPEVTIDQQHGPSTTVQRCRPHGEYSYEDFSDLIIFTNSIDLPGIMNAYNSNLEE